MAQPRQARPVGRGRRPVRRWTLGAAAPIWFRRIWGERSREVPRLSRVDLDRMRRIAYL
jgi:hypothetical protein